VSLSCTAVNVKIKQRSRVRVRKCVFENSLGMGIQAVNSEFTIDENTFSDMHNSSIQIALNATGNMRENSFVCERSQGVNNSFGKFGSSNSEQQLLSSLRNGCVRL
jgi:hypothetical protein